MHISKSYLHDRLVLLQLSICVFLAVAGSLLVFLRLDSGSGENYIVRYRSNLGIGAFQAGKSIDILAFIIFMMLVLGLHVALSIRTHKIHRQYAVVILGMANLLLILAIIVSNSLLVLR